MEMDDSFGETDDIDDIDDADDVVDDMIADSCVVRIIDEMEFFEEDFDYFDESEIQRDLT